MRSIAPDLPAIPDSASGLLMPHGLDAWLVGFVTDVVRETEFLRANGAAEHAQARDRVICQFHAAAAAWLRTELTVAEVAKETGRCEETVRRAVRDGKVPDRRSGKKGRLSIRRGDAGALDSRRGKRYDPTADAQDIAKIRKGAA